MNLEPKTPSIQYNHSARVIPFDQVEDISSYVFYIIQVELALQFSTTSTIPVELSIIKMNLKSGELDNFHRIIDPGYIAPWYIVLCMLKLNLYILVTLTRLHGTRKISVDYHLI